MSEEKFRVIYDTSEETRIKELARMREKALHDEATYLKEAREEGFAKGYAEGYAKGYAEGYAQGYAEGYAQKNQEIASRMRELGYSEDIINEILTK